MPHRQRRGKTFAGLWIPEPEQLRWRFCSLSRAGVNYANGEFVQVHPTAIPGTDKQHLMSESARGEGGRVWVPRKPQDDRDPMSIPVSDRYYFLEERYPTFGNLVPRDIATREIFDVCITQGLSVEPDRPCVYLDVTGLSSEALRKLEGILEIYEKFQGVDPRKTPMTVYIPVIHRIIPIIT